MSVRRVQPEVLFDERPDVKFKDADLIGGGALPGSELFPDDPSQRLFQRLSLPLHELSQGDVDQGLVITTTCRVDLILEPLNEVVVEPDRDSRLPG